MDAFAVPKYVGFLACAGDPDDSAGGQQSQIAREVRFTGMMGWFVAGVSAVARTPFLSLSSLFVSIFSNIRSAFSMTSARERMPSRSSSAACPRMNHPIALREPPLRPPYSLTRGSTTIGVGQFSWLPVDDSPSYDSV